MKETMIETFSPEETHALGKKIGQQAKPGDVYTLIGDLGVGKNCIYAGNCGGSWYQGTNLQPDIYHRTGL
mgnify:CR=1 FL=1